MDVPKTQNFPRVNEEGDEDEIGLINGVPQPSLVWVSPLCRTPHLIAPLQQKLMEARELGLFLHAAGVCSVSCLGMSRRSENGSGPEILATKYRELTNAGITLRSADGCLTLAA